MGERPAGGDKGAVRLVGLEVKGRGCSVQSLPRKPGEPIQQSSWPGLTVATQLLQVSQCPHPCSNIMHQVSHVTCEPGCVSMTEAQPWTAGQG